MKVEIIKKVTEKKAITEEEVNIFLSYFCNKIRYECGITKELNTDYRVCFKTAKVFGQFMLIKFDCDVNTLNIKELLEIPITHYFNVIKLNVDNTIKTYLVDMTFCQFFDKTVTLDDNKKISTTKAISILKDDYDINVLRSKGFIEISDTILKKYLELFIKICKNNKKTKIISNYVKKLSQTDRYYISKNNFI